jgi:hypothetical protein
MLSCASRCSYMQIDMVAMHQDNVSFSKSTEHLPFGILQTATEINTNTNVLLCRFPYSVRA